MIHRFCIHTDRGCLDLIPKQFLEISGGFPDPTTRALVNHCWGNSDFWSFMYLPSKTPFSIISLGVMFGTLPTRALHSEKSPKPASSLYDGYGQGLIRSWTLTNRPGRNDDSDLG